MRSEPVRVLFGIHGLICRAAWRNRGDSWTVTPQLLADVLTWAGQKSCEYALTAIGGGYVRRPLPYLRRTLQCAVSRGKRSSRSSDSPVAMAVAMARRMGVGTGDCRRRRGDHRRGRRQANRVRRFISPAAWQDAVGTGTGEGNSRLILTQPAAPNRCIGLKGLPGDDVNYKNLEDRNLESSSGSVKADATWEPCAELDLDRTAGSPDKPDVSLMAAYGRALGLPTLERDKLEQPVKTGALHDSDVIRRRGSDGEARKLVQAALDPLPREKEHPVLEHGRCRHPLANLMAIAMVLDDVVLVECVAGCGHRLYSGSGPVGMPLPLATGEGGQSGPRVAARPSGNCPYRVTWDYHVRGLNAKQR